MKKSNKIILESILIAVSFINPLFLSNFIFFDYLFFLMKLVMCFYIFVKLIKNKKIYKTNIFIILIFIFFLQLVFSTLLNHGSIFNVFKYVFSIIFVLLYFNSLEKEEINDFLKGFTIYLKLLVYINFITVLLFPNGFYGGIKSEFETYYFLGHNNTAIKIILPAIIFSALYDFRTKNIITHKTWLLLIVSFINVTITWSNTSMIGLFIVFVMFLYITFFKKRLKIFNNKLLFFIPIILFAVLIIIGRFEFVRFLIEDILHKDMSLTGRTLIWDNSLEAIKDSFVYGYGYGVKIYDIIPMSSTPNSCHNYFLDLLFRGGILHLLVQIIMNYLALKELKFDDNEKAVIYIALIAYFVMWQVSIFITDGVSLMFIILLYGYKINNLNKKVT